MSQYTRKLTKRERILRWVIERLDRKRESIAEREWEKIRS